MFLLGLIAIAQMAVLPGALLLKCFPDEDRNLLESAIYAFCLSLTANAVLVPLLVLVHSYTANALCLIIAAEVGLLLRTGILKQMRWRPTVDAARLRDLFRPKGFVISLATIAAMATIGVYLRICYQNWGTVFRLVDDVANWDRWACSWAAERFPTATWWYPQLLPANWSLTYVLIGTIDVKMFAKSVGPVFPLLTLLLFASLASRRDRLAHLLGLTVSGWLFLHYIGISFLNSGYTDVPLAFFCFAAFYPFYLRRFAADHGGASTAPPASQGKTKHGKPLSPPAPSIPKPPPEGVTESNIGSGDWLGLTLVSGAMLLKQGAIFALAACLLWFGYKAVRGGWRSLWGAPRSASTVGLAALCSVAVWYGYKFAQIHAGTEASNLTDLMHTIHAGRGYLERIAVAGQMIWRIRGVTGPMVTAIVGILYLVGFFVRPVRSVALWLATPFLAAWGLWFSYEIRTASPVFPFVGLVAGFSIVRILGFRPLPWLRGPSGAVVAATLSVVLSGCLVALAWQIPVFRDPWIAEAIALYSPWLLLAGMGVLAMSLWRFKNDNVRLWWPEIGLAVLAVLAAHTSFRWDAILNDQAIQLRRVGAPALNERLYAAVQERHITSGIVTTYWPLRVLPAIRQLFRWPVWIAPCPLPILRTVPLAVPDAGYILIAENDLDDSARAALASTPDLRTLFVEQGFRMIEIVRSAPAPAVQPPSASSPKGTIPPGQPVVGFLDLVNGQPFLAVTSGGEVPISGWAGCANPSSPLAKVEILVDGQPMAKATVSLPRPDVATAFGRPDFEHSGWKASFAARGLNAGPHPLRARVTCADGKNGTLPPFQLVVMGK